MPFFGKSTKHIPSTLLICALSIPILTACAMARGIWRGEVSGKTDTLQFVQDACEANAFIVIGDRIYECAVAQPDTYPAALRLAGKPVSPGPDVSVSESDIRF